MESVRRQLLDEEHRGLGVMEATKAAREYVAQVMAISPETQKQELEELEFSIEENFQTGTLLKAELEESLEDLRSSTELRDADPPESPSNPQ